MWMTLILDDISGFGARCTNEHLRGGPKPVIWPWNRQGYNLYIYKVVLWSEILKWGKGLEKF